MNKNYQSIALIYDHLMKSIDYSEWAEYLLDILKDRNCGFTSALEFGAGTCKISAHLADKFQFYVASDLSSEMLRLFSANNNIIKVCCDMKLNSFTNKYEVVLAVFDTINYILTEKDLTKFFSDVKSILRKKGFFIFDASLENNSKKNTKRLNRKGKHKGISYIQKSFYDKETKIHYNNFEIISSNEKFIEEHKQKIYPLEQYFKSIENAGLTVLDCFDCFSFDDVNHKSERAQFVVSN